MPRSATQEVLDEQSGDSGDEFNDDQQASGSNAATRGGRKRNGSSSTTNRRDQNRIAQREFRQRKQQRTRELEMKVDLLSLSKDEAFKTLNGMVQDLMKENQSLRQLVRDLSGFIGQGIGGITPQIGWDPARFQEFISRGETDTAFKSYQTHKNANVQVPVAGSSTQTSAIAGQKRPIETEASTSRKRPRVELPESESRMVSAVTEQTTAFELPGGEGFFPSITQLPQQSSINMQQHSYNDNVSSAGEIQRSNSAPNPHPYASTSQAHTINNSNNVLPDGKVDNIIQRLAVGYSGATTNVPAGTAPDLYMSNIRDQPGTPAVSHNEPTMRGRRVLGIANNDEYVDSIGRMIRYHLECYRQDPTYALPPSLVPTVVQRSLPHDRLIDGIIIPSIRDKMILSAGSFDLADCMHSLFSQWVFHGGNLDPEYIEIGEAWLREYGFLCDASTLQITNKWRAKRGEAEIPFSVLVRAPSP